MTVPQLRIYMILFTIAVVVLVAALFYVTWKHHKTDRKDDYS